METCNNTSVGIIVVRNETLLVINRKKPPFGIALPAGHVEGVSPQEPDFADAAKRELQEETGLQATSVTLIGEGRKDNPCRRGASWHYWRLYRAEVVGELSPSVEETNGAAWIDRETLRRLLAGESITIGSKTIGLEPVWRAWLLEVDPFA